MHKIKEALQYKRIMSDWLVVFNFSKEQEDIVRFYAHFDKKLVPFFLKHVNAAQFDNGKGYKINISHILRQFYLYENALNMLEKNTKKRKKKAEVLSLFDTCFIWIFIYIQCEWDKIALLPLPRLIKKWLQEYVTPCEWAIPRAEDWVLLHNIRLRIKNVENYDSSLDSDIASFFLHATNMKNFNNGNGYKRNISDILKQLILYENGRKLLNEHPYRGKQMKQRYIMSLNGICCTWIFIYIMCDWNKIELLPLPGLLRQCIAEYALCCEWYEQYKYLEVPLMANIEYDLDLQLL